MDARRVVEEWAAALDRGDLDASMEFISQDVDWANPVASVRGVEPLRALLDVFWTAIPDFKHNITSIVESDGLVACEGVASGTHSGPLAAPTGEVPATGKSISFPFAGWARVEDDRIVRFRGYWDVAGFMAQLSATPDRAAATV